MRRAVLVCGAALVLLLVVYGVYWLSLSDETRIRELLGGMAADFSSGAVGGCVDGLAPDFREEVASLGKQEVHQLLVALWMREKDPKTKGFFPCRAAARGDAHRDRPRAPGRGGCDAPGALRRRAAQGG